MRKKTLWKAVLPAVLLVQPSWGVAADAPAAGPARQVAAEDGHAEHADATAENGSRREKGGGSTAWTDYPVLKVRAGGEGRDRRLVMVIPQGISVGSIDAYSNNLDDARGHRQLPLEMAGARLDRPEDGGFHWLSAREEQDDKVRVASTVHFFAGSSGKNPTAMFMQQKHELEIIPQPYPREHSRYRANEDWKFLLRFNGKPLTSQKLLLQTANGTRTELVSDAQGRVTIRIPDDFKDESRPKTAGDHAHERRSADFILATEHMEGGKNYLTTFNAAYGTDAFDQRSLAMGLGFTLLGMVGASPLLRQRKDRKADAHAGKNTDAPVMGEAPKKEDA